MLQEALERRIAGLIAAPDKIRTCKDLAGKSVTAETEEHLFGISSTSMTVGQPELKEAPKEVKDVLKRLGLSLEEDRVRIRLLLGLPWGYQGNGFTIVMEPEEVEEDRFGILISSNGKCKLLMEEKYPNGGTIDHDMEKFRRLRGIYESTPHTTLVHDDSDTPVCPNDLIAGVLATAPDWLIDCLKLTTPHQELE